ncbi:MAG: hypothetical protein QG649_176 [Patescibacteria group bacterium]|nr:hypothetical protein [Patescibacteria group bacterium]
MNREKSSTLFVIAAIAVMVLGIAAAGYVILKDKPAATQPKEEAVVSSQVDSQISNKQPTALLPTIVFTDKGFTQPTYTFPEGLEVRVHNQSKMNLQFSSDDHPTHTEHTEMNLKTLKPDESATFKPAGKGTYMFHDHLNDRYTGTLIIQ